MPRFENGQTCLENRGITARHEMQARSDYNAENPYSETHPDALSTGDPQGKGSGNGGHTFYLPDCTKPTNMIDYSNFDTRDFEHIGGQYDIEGYKGRAGRREMMARSFYNEEAPYGHEYVNTELNREEGQYSSY